MFSAGQFGGFLVERIVERFEASLSSLKPAQERKGHKAVSDSHSHQIELHFLLHQKGLHMNIPFDNIGDSNLLPKKRLEF